MYAHSYTHIRTYTHTHKHTNTHVQGQGHVELSDAEPGGPVPRENVICTGHSVREDVICSGKSVRTVLGQFRVGVPSPVRR
jgi:hypothetical protein